MDHTAEPGGSALWSKIQSLTEALTDPQVAAQNMVLDVPHPAHGNVRMKGFQNRFSATELSVRHPAPDLGAHSVSVLADAGFTPENIASLLADGTVSQGQAAIIVAVAIPLRSMSTVSTRNCSFKIKYTARRLTEKASWQ